MSSSSVRVANRYLARQAVAQAMAAPLRRVAGRGAERVRREMTAEVLEAFAEAVILRPVRVASLTQRIKQLWDLFQTAPKKWEEFKKMLGVKATSWFGVARELPSLIRGWLADGEKYLSLIGKTLSKNVPILQLYLDVGVKMPSVGEWLASVTKALPIALKRGLSAISAKATSFAEWLDSLELERRLVKPVSRVVKGGLFAFIWFNSTELSWDVSSILLGFMGEISFVQLIQSLPESALGFLVKVMFPGIPGGLIWNVFLPITIVLRIGWLIQKKYVTWDPGRSLTIHWDRLGLTQPALVPATVRI